MLFKPLSHTNSTQIMTFLAASFATIQKILQQLSSPYFRHDFFRTRFGIWLRQQFILLFSKTFLPLGTETAFGIVIL